MRPLTKKVLELNMGLDVACNTTHQVSRHSHIGMPAMRMPTGGVSSSEMLLPGQIGQAFCVIPNSFDS